METLNPEDYEKMNELLIKAFCSSAEALRKLGEGFSSRIFIQPDNFLQALRDHKRYKKGNNK